MSTVKTAKGTELPMLDLKGKDYLEVKYRLVWVREEHPDWGIETEIVSVTEKSCLTRATVRDATGRVLATSHKFENQQGFPDFIEKSETGAIGRALAVCGYGTQFTDDLEEGERIVDSPVVPKKTAPKAAERPAAPTATVRPRTPSTDQIKRLFAIMTEHRIPEDALRHHVATNFTDPQGKPIISTKDLSIAQYDRVILDIKDNRVIKEPGANG